MRPAEYRTRRTRVEVACPLTAVASGSTVAATLSWRPRASAGTTGFYNSHFDSFVHFYYHSAYFWLRLSKRLVLYVALLLNSILRYIGGVSLCQSTMLMENVDQKVKKYSRKESILN